MMDHLQLVWHKVVAIAHLLPSNGAQKSALKIAPYFNNAKPYELQNRHIYSSRGPGHMTQF